jgi:5S rRNA maturation endonuclease (ribonuclease M5)
MSPESKKHYFLRIAPRYQNASKKDKSRILQEFCQVCGYHRKYAISKLCSFKKGPRKQSPRNKPGRKSQYHHPDLIEALKSIWIATNLICSKRLKAAIPHWIGHYQHAHRFLTPAILRKIVKASPSTIDRLLKPVRHLYQGKGRCTTKPGLLLKSQIAIKTKQWDEFRPGFLESDTVAHCGTSVAGHFAYTTNSVDIATGWTEQRATYGKGFRDIAIQIENMEKSLPFAILGFDSDNGGEFINDFLFRYFRHREKPIDFTRSREYQKNDNAHVEGKNWTHVRQWLGYRRFENPIIVDLLNDLYKSEWRLYHNFFIPSGKLLSKQRIASKTIKKHDKPKTPYQRILESKHVSESTKLQLRETFKTLNPFKLKDAIDKKIARIHQLAQ